MRLYSRTGDAGETSLADGSRVSKADLRVNACGEVDELNACLGWCRQAAGADLIAARVSTLQAELLSIGSELARAPGTAIGAPLRPPDTPSCQRLEAWIDEAGEHLRPIGNFIVPGGTELAARLHLARTCCRRAERSVVGLARSSTVRPGVLAYLNRLSDLLFAWARQANHEAGLPDDLWIAAGNEGEGLAPRG